VPTSYSILRGFILEVRTDAHRALLYRSYLSHNRAMKILGLLNHLSLQGVVLINGRKIK